MKSRRVGAVLAVILIPILALALGACRSTAQASAPQAVPGPAAPTPQIIQPGRPGESSRVIAAETSARSAALPHTAADAKFMQGMIPHHSQALEMAALVFTNSTSEAMKMLAKRIEASQLDEIGMMKGWLTARREALPDDHAHHAGDHALMPGMLTQAEMRQLASAKGVEFDRLFLVGMIKHHQGALTMVRELFASPGAGQDAEIFAFASDVDADQSMEIDRMAAMLAMLKERGE
jgi:uncharacterized protein (DUF305 family)